MQQKYLQRGTPMKQTPQRSRVIAMIVIVGGLFLSAILLWLYSTGRLGASADVQLGEENRVTIDFDEITTDTECPGLVQCINDTPQARDIYKSYGVLFKSASTEGYTIGGNAQGGGAYADSAVITSAAQLAVHHTPAFPLLTPKLQPTSPSNALAGSTPAYWTNGYVPKIDTSKPILIQFVNPDNPEEVSSTNFVKFQLSSDTSRTLSRVSVTAKDTEGKTLTTRTYSTGTAAVELNQPNISLVEVKIDGSALTAIQGFVIDDVQFTIPGTNLSGSAALTANGTQFTHGQEVHLVFTNTGNTTLTCPSPLGYSVTQENVPVFTSPGARDVQNIAKGQQKTFSWDLKNSSGSYVSAGTYTVKAECANNVIAKTNIAVIDSAVGTLDAQLTTDKTTYKPGEDVTITLTNTGSNPFTCGGSAYRVIGSAGTEIFAASSSVDTYPPIMPGQWVRWTWGQKNSTNAQVPDGIYTIEVRCGDIVRYVGISISSQAVHNLNFTVDPTEGPAPLTVIAEYAGDLDQSTLTWDFGDGSPALFGGAIRSHVYRTAGTYVVTLRSGPTSAGTRQVIVTSPEPNQPFDQNPNEPSSGGPTITNHTAPMNISSLVSTGGNLVVNLAVATVLSLIASWYIFRKKQ
jgi:hypothetical protein